MPVISDVYRRAIQKAQKPRLSDSDLEKLRKQIKSAWPFRDRACYTISKYMHQASSLRRDITAHLRREDDVSVLKRCILAYSSHSDTPIAVSALQNRKKRMRIVATRELGVSSLYNEAVRKKLLTLANSSDVTTRSARRLKALSQKALLRSVQYGILLSPGLMPSTMALRYFSIIFDYAKKRKDLRPILPLIIAGMVAKGALKDTKMRKLVFTAKNLDLERAYRLVKNGGVKKAFPVDTSSTSDSARMFFAQILKGWDSRLPKDIMGPFSPKVLCPIEAKIIDESMNFSLALRAYFCAPPPRPYGLMVAAALGRNRDAGSVEGGCGETVTIREQGSGEPLRNSIQVRCSYGGGTWGGNLFSWKSQADRFVSLDSVKWNGGRTTVPVSKCSSSNNYKYCIGWEDLHFITMTGHKCNFVTYENRQVNKKLRAYGCE